VAPHGGPARLTEVAARAGVSLATASRVLNGSERVVGEPHRSRVLTAARQLGYRVNPHAQAIARGESNLVGLVVHDLADPYFFTIADGVMQQCEERGLVVMLASTRRDPEREVEYMATLRAQRARAVVIVGSRTADREVTGRLAKEVRAYAESGGRVACVSQNRLGTNTVVVENRAGARQLSQELVGLGHRRFAVLAGPPDLVTARDRKTGFIDGLVRAGIAPDDVLVVHGPFTRDADTTRPSSSSPPGCRRPASSPATTSSRSAPSPPSGTTASPSPGTSPSPASTTSRPSATSCRH